jgi:hypothetical protein
MVGGWLVPGPLASKLRVALDEAAGCVPRDHAPRHGCPLCRDRQPTEAAICNAHPHKPKAVATYPIWCGETSRAALRSEGSRPLAGSAQRAFLRWHPTGEAKPHELVGFDGTVCICTAWAAAGAVPSPLRAS